MRTGRPYSTSQVVGLATQACVPGRMRKIGRFPDLKFHLRPDVLMDVGAYSVCMADIRVLIVDDVERVRQDLRTFLTLTGNIEVVAEAGDGFQAIRLVAALRPQVVLMDLEMPVMDGFEAARQIKALQPACRVIALTIHGGEVEQQRAMQAGADDFIVKGASLEYLLESIRTAPLERQTNQKGE